MTEIRYWGWNVLAALIVLLLLGVHMAIMHLDGILSLLGATAEPLDWGPVMARAGSGAFTLTYILLLASALFHGLYGFRTMLTEFSGRDGSEKMITLACWVAGVGLFSVGAGASLWLYFSSPDG